MGRPVGHCGQSQGPPTIDLNSLLNALNPAGCCVITGLSCHSLHSCCEKISFGRRSYALKSRENAVARVPLEVAAIVRIRTLIFIFVQNHSLGLCVLKRYIAVIKPFPAQAFGHEKCNHFFIIQL
jgi:hypothetical protein